jgi:HSP20 family protein
MAQWNPLHDLVSLQDRMNRLFEDATQRQTSETDQGEVIERADWCPAADILESQDEYTISLDVPGIDRDTLDISVDDNRLTVKGNRPAEETALHRGECPRGSFLRTFSVPTAVDQTAIKANYKDGVLKVRLPRRAEKKSHRVEIKVS